MHGPAKLAEKGLLSNPAFIIAIYCTFIIAIYCRVISF